MKTTARILVGILLLLALAIPQSANAVLDRAMCSTADKGGTGPCVGSVVISSTNEEISHAYDLGIINLTSVAGTNTITATAVPAITAYVDGAHYDLEPAGGNTGAVTLAISGLPAKALTGISGSALVGGELITNARMLVVYDASSDKFKLESQGAAAAVFGGSGASHSTGLVPDPGSTAGVTRYLREDSTWVAGTTANAPLLLNSMTASGSASLSDTTSFTSTYRYYRIVLQNVVPATNNVNLLFKPQISATFQTGVKSQIFEGSPGVASIFSSSTTEILRSISNISGGGASGEITIYNPAASGTYKPIESRMAGLANGGTDTVSDVVSMQYLSSTAAMTGFQLIETAGNIASGEVDVYGYN